MKLHQSVSDDGTHHLSLCCGELHLDLLYNPVLELVRTDWVTLNLPRLLLHITFLSVLVLVLG